MPFFLLAIGFIALVAAIRGNQDDLLTVIKSDLTGPNNFFLWIAAVVLIVALGQIKSLRGISDAFLGLVILVIIVANNKNGKNILESFVSQVKRGTS